MRNMSFMLTTEQIRNRSKTVTRRLGWHHLKPGQKVAACKKCMGLKKGETIERLAELMIISAKREPLSCMMIYGPAECAAEGFPEMSPAEFIAFFCASHKGCSSDSIVTRIEFEYCEPESLL